MSLVDDIFSSIPSPLINQLGIAATYIKANTGQTYNPQTGTVSGAATEISVKIIISELKPQELQGFYQRTDIKILIDAAALSGYYPRTTDSIRYLQNGVNRTAKIIDIYSYRGDFPILHTVIARVG